MSAVQLSQVYRKSTSGKSNDEDDREYKRFIWDVVFRYFSVLGVTLVVIGLGEEFFLERGLGCNTPDYVNRDQYSYVVLWCSRNVRLIDLLPLLILTQTLCILAPQVLWEVFAAPSLEQFFSMIPKLQRLRYKRTGNYDVDTSRIVSHLREKYRGKRSLQPFYLYKLIIQLCFCYAFILLMLGLYQGGTVFEIDFVCSQVGSVETADQFNVSMIEGLDPFNVRCTYTTSQAFFPLWIADVVLLSIAALVGTFGARWINRNHWKELDHKGRADYYYSFAMNMGEYNPADSHKCTVKMNDDLGFLTLLLFNSDRGQGETFYDVQVELNLQERWATDYERHANYMTKISSSPSKRTAIEEELKKLMSESERSDQPSQENDVREDQKNEVHLVPCHLGKHLIHVCTKMVDWKLNMYQRTLHLFCGSRGCTLALARLSEETYAVDFNAFCYLTPTLEKGLETDKDSNAEETKPNIVEEKFRNILHFRVPADIASKTGQESAQLTTSLTKTKVSEDRRPLEYNLVVVTCMEPNFRPSAAKVILETVFSSCKLEHSLFVVCAEKKSLVEEVMADLEVYCDEVQLVKDDTGNQIQIEPGLKPSQDLKCFYFNGQKVDLFLQVAKLKNPAKPPTNGQVHETNEQDQERNDQNQELSEQERNEHDQELDEQEQNEHDQESNEQDQEINEHDQQLNEHDPEITEQNQEVNEQDRQLNGKDEEVNEQNQELNELVQELNKKDQESIEKAKESEV